MKTIDTATIEALILKKRRQADALQARAQELGGLLQQTQSELHITMAQVEGFESLLKAQDPAPGNMPNKTEDKPNDSPDS